ncbi:Nse4-domain-containing protein [Plenodomus tracheiphilus IPT5]|uniref:Non-structural maintenance of chromosomes element 4 n=1 Tax=Plenodomus tracheiphilus IPT5 TaxID=1408161 RepID=A0A6A7AR67_9PLEO|nr:Nse4-domain-containing protein [Plenodomus tracheiphilus IPT5]
MARLNTHRSATPQQTRSSTVDSLYRDPSVAPRRAPSNARTSSYSVLSPTHSQASDKENDNPASREATPRNSKGRGLRSASARMPTPDSGSATGASGNKRRRTGNYSMRELETNGREPDDEALEVHQDDEGQGEAIPTQPEPEEEGDLRFYNPHQDPEQRRWLRATMRDLQRTVDDDRDEIVKPNGRLLHVLQKQDNLFGKVRQTADAALDSRFLVNASELAGRKLNHSMQRSAAVGIDLDQFVSKCIYFMKSGGHVAGQADAPSIPVNDDDENEDPDGLDWALLGRYACFPCNRRPPTTSFLLGPLSVQKRVRATQRKARSQRQPVGPATRPQEIQEGDIQQSENSNLSNLVKGIRGQLEKHLERGMAGVEDELGHIAEDDLTDEDQAAAFRRFRITKAPSGEAAVSLLDFAINPHDFGQTVENLFYVSFLVREGNVKIAKDEHGLPLLLPAEPHGVSDQREKNVQKHQAVFSFDYPTWDMFIQAFDIQQPIIPHREREQQTVGSAGWYTG